MPAVHRGLAVDQQEADPDSLLNDFRRFLHWRRTRPALRHGSLRPLNLLEPLVGFVRDHTDQRIAAVFNLSGASATFDGRTIQPYGVLFDEAPALVQLV